jgi:hypothetical protein
MDYRKDKCYNLFVCNDYIKLRMNEFVVKSEYGVLLDENRTYKNLIEDIIRDHTGIIQGIMHRPKKRNNLNPTFYVEICSRPTMYMPMLFSSALKTLSSTKDRRLYYQLLERTESTFNSVVDYMARYIKYKVDYKKLKRLQKNFRLITFNNADSNDRIIQIIDLITKYNIK